MGFKPNYSFERRQRDQAKAAKKAARLQAKRDKAANKNEADETVADETVADEREPSAEPEKE